jgi:predicted DsbA family dithiol-disulfide isomerase
MGGRLPITIFTDFTDPIAYVTESALREAARSHGASVTYRAMEMYPATTPLPDPDVMSGRLAAAADAAAAEALPLHPPPVVPRTRKAHEAALFAAERGKGDAMRDAIHRAFWEHGADIGRVDVLVEIGARLGFDPADLKIALDIDRYSDEVAREGKIARRLRIPGVPAVYLGTGAEARILVGLHDRAALDAAIRTR